MSPLFKLYGTITMAKMISWEEYCKFFWELPEVDQKMFIALNGNGINGRDRRNLLKEAIKELKK